MTTHFHAVLTCVGVWGAEDADHRFIDDLGTVSDVGIMDGVGCDISAANRADGTDGGKSIWAADADDAEGAACRGCGSADGICTGHDSFGDVGSIVGLSGALYKIIDVSPFRLPAI